MILAGDVGGTKTFLALFDESGSRLAPAQEQSFPSRDFSSLEEVLSRFLGPLPGIRLRAACFAVAGPAIGGKVKTINLPWEVDEQAVASLLATEVKLLNDLEGAAHGLLGLGAEALEVLQPGVDRQGNRALIAAGTGLGEAILVWDAGRYHVVATEGGHTDFAPRTDQETALLAFLRREYGHVSYERLVSGPGLFNIYRFLRETGDVPEPEWVRHRLAQGDPSAAISEMALSQAHPLPVQALELFVSIYGAEAGNLALKSLSLGGVFIGGGIAPKILPKLKAGPFLGAFLDKGRLESVMRAFRVSVITDPRAALLGAASVARGLGSP